METLRICGDVTGSAGSTDLSISDGQDGGWNPLLDEENGLSQELEYKLKLGPKCE